MIIRANFNHLGLTKKPTPKVTNPIKANGINFSVSGQFTIISNKDGIIFSLDLHATALLFKYASMKPSRSPSSTPWALPTS